MLISPWCIVSGDGWIFKAVWHRDFTEGIEKGYLGVTAAGQLRREGGATVLMGRECVQPKDNRKTDLPGGKSPRPNWLMHDADRGRVQLKVRELDSPPSAAGRCRKRQSI
jgi:hypothetical protein